jgi:hypothetical protein
VFPHTVVIDGYERFTMSTENPNETTAVGDVADPATPMLDAREVLLRENIALITAMSEMRKQHFAMEAQMLEERRRAVAHEVEETGRARAQLRRAEEEIIRLEREFSLMQTELTVRKMTHEFELERARGPEHQRESSREQFVAACTAFFASEAGTRFVRLAKGPVTTMLQGLFDLLAGMAGTAPGTPVPDQAAEPEPATPT